MLAPLLAAALAVAPPAPLELSLQCRGTVREDQVENQSTVGGPSFTVRTPVLRDGFLSVELHGTAGAVIFDNGAAHDFKDAIVEPTRIIATYARLFGLSRPRIDIDRLTGAIIVTEHGGVYFRGVCDRAPPPPLHPKF